MKLKELPKVFNIDEIKVFCDSRLRAEVMIDNVFTQEVFQGNSLVEPYLNNEIVDMSVSCPNYLGSYRVLEITLK